MKNVRTYTVSKEPETGKWCAHKAGFDWIPILESFSDTRKQAQRHAADAMALPLKEYLPLRELPKM